MDRANNLRTILVIDDEELLRQLYCSLLEKLGYQVLTAENGRIGLDLIEKKHPDLVLTDLRMPEMDGMELIRQSTRLVPEIPIIVISGTGNVSDAIKAIRLGAYDYLTKPVYGLDVLEHTVGKALEKAELLRENRAYQENLEELVRDRTCQLKSANANLEKINVRLQKIVKTTQGFSACIDVSSISTRILDEFASHMGASGGSLYFVESDGLRLIHTLDILHTPDFLPFPLPERSIFSQLLADGKPLLIEDIATHSIEPSGWDGYSDGSLLAFPLHKKDGAIMGLLTLHSKDPSPFIEQDREIGTILVSYSCEAIGSIYATETLRESESRFREMADMLPLSICETDAAGAVTYANRKVSESYGYDVDELNGGMSVFEMIAPGERRKAALNTLRVILDGENSSTGTEYTAQRKDGSQFPVLIYSSPIMGKDNSVGLRSATVDMTIFKQQQELILHHSHFDTLTDLPNRFLVMDRLKQLIKDAQRLGQRVAVIFIDLDDFKKINDALGHEAGDQFLIQAAERLQDAACNGDTVGRLGGDEFIVLQSGLSKASDASLVANNLLDRFRTPFIQDGKELVLTASLGIAIYPEDGDNPAELLRNADTAMYYSKEQGRNAYHYFTGDMNSATARRLVLEEQLHGALERGELHLNYQPLVKIPGRTVVGVEALLRWSSPVLGCIPPDEFIPILEQNGQIVPVGRFVITEALAMAAQWQQHRDFKIAVNLSPRQFRDPELLQHIEQALLESGVNKGSLELEITEGVLMSRSASIDESLAALNRLGVTIAMDDFGTGYSSLSYLRKYQFNTLKIDRSFVRDITTNTADRELVNTSITMARNLGLNVVAEGVETEEQLDVLSELDCGLAQGYLFSRPVPAEEIYGMLAANHH